MTETFHDLLTRTVGTLGYPDIVDKSRVCKKRNKSNVKVVDWNANDGQLVNQYLCQEMARALSNVSVENGCDSNRVQRHIQSKNHSVVVVFDELAAFDMDICRSVVQDHSFLKHVLLLRETDKVKFFVNVCALLREEATYSNHIKYIVIYCSGENHEKIMKLLKKLNHRSLRVMVITTGRWGRTWTIELKEGETVIFRKTQEVKD